MKKPTKFVILPGNGPNKKSRITYKGGNGKTIMFGEGYVGGTAAAKEVIAKIKKEVARAKVIIKTAPTTKKIGSKKR